MPPKTDKSTSGETKKTTQLVKKKTLRRETTEKFSELSKAKSAELPIKEWDTAKIDQDNIASFKEFQKECMRKHYDVKMKTETLPNFVDYASTKMGESKIFQDSQWTYTHHTYEVYGCTNSMCGFYIISASRDMHINIVHQYQMKCVQRWKAHTSTIMRCRITNDDKYLATCSFDKTIKIWELDKSNDYSNAPTEKQVLNGHTEWVYDVRFHPDESTHKLLSCSSDHSLKIWNWLEGTCLKTISKAHDIIRVCIWSEDGKQIISGGQDALVKIWDAESGTVLKELIGHTTYVLSMDIRGKRLVTGSTDKTIRVWNTESGELKKTILYHTKNVESLQFLPKSKNRILSSSLDKSIRIFDIDTGVQEYVIEGHTGGVYCAVFSPDARFVVSASADKSVKLTKIEIDKLEQNRAGFHSGIIWGVAFSPNNKWYATSSADKNVKLWDYYSYNVKHTLTGHGNHVTTVNFTTDSQYLISTCYDGTTKIWKVEDGTCVATINDQGGKVVWYADCRKDQKMLATAGGSWKVMVYDLTDISTPTLKHTLEGHTYDVLSCRWNPFDDNLIFSGSSDSSVRVWNVSEEKCVTTIKGHGSIIYHIVFLDPPYFATSSMDTTVRIWDYDGRCRNVLRGHTHPVPALCASPDRKRLFSGGQDSEIKIWDVSTGQLEHSWRGHAAWVRGLAIDPNGERIISVSDDATCRVWKLSNILYNYFPFLKANIQDEPETIRDIAEANPVYITNGFYRSEFTIIHLLAYYGNVSALKHIFHACKSLPDGRVDFSKDISGRSPMHYAFESSNLNVIEYFLNVLQEYPPLLCSVFWDIIPDLIALDLPSMGAFIDSRILPPMPGPKPIPKFSIYVRDPTAYASGESVQLTDYSEMAPSRVEKEKIVPIRIGCVYIYDFQSVEFMKAISSVSDPVLFKSVAIRGLLKHKWETYARRQYLREFAMFVLLISLFVAFSWAEVNKDDETWINALRYICGIPLILATGNWAKGEISQMRKSPTIAEYLWDIWNIFDITLVILMFLIMILIIIEEVSSNSDWEQFTSDVMALAALIYWMRLISFLRGFRKFGSMVRIIIEIIKDVRYFMVILLVTIIGFSQAIGMFEDNSPKHVSETEVKLQYQLMLGDWDTEGYDGFQWLYFLLGSFFGMLILLNLLIALMTETYIRIQQEAESHSFKEWAQWIYDIDKGVNSPGKGKLAQYLFMCLPIEVGEDDQEITTDSLYEDAQNFRRESNKLAEKIQDKLDKKLKKTQKLITNL